MIVMINEYLIIGCLLGTIKCFMCLISFEPQSNLKR